MRKTGWNKLKPSNGAISARQLNDAMNESQRTRRSMLTGGMQIGGSLHTRKDGRGLGIGDIVVVKVISNATGGGKYNGRILRGRSTAVATGNLSMPEGLTVPAANDSLVLNMRENGASTHWVAANTFALGEIVGMTAAGLFIVTTEILEVGTHVTPFTIPEGDDGDAETTEWDIDDQPEGYDGVTYSPSRVYWSGVTTESFYWFVRQPTFDSIGRLVHVGPEVNTYTKGTKACS